MKAPRIGPRALTRLVLAVLSIAVTPVSIAPRTAQAAGTIVVTTTADNFGTDPSTCSLREAIRAANEGGNFDGCALLAPL
jgi:CSLREA domain-containing protein